MSYRAFCTYTCDNCGKTETVEGSAMPQGWTGERAVVPGDESLMYSNWIGTPRTHYCDDCNKASLEAGRAALEARKA